VEAPGDRCRVLASQIERKLKRPEHFVDEFSLAHFYASLLRALPMSSDRKVDSRLTRHLLPR
jgi:hypothetical protein